MRVAFVGSKGLGLKVLSVLRALSPDALCGIVTIDDSTDTRTAFTDFQRFAAEHAVSLHCAKSRKHSEEIIKELSPDLCIVVGWYWMISEDLLQRVPRGFIGIHNSLLPEFRGGSPLIWPILLGHNRTGCSLFSFTPGMDDGPIWAQATIEIGESDYIAEILDRTEGKAIELFREAYPRILAGTLTPTEQDHFYATYCASRNSQDGAIDWHKPAREVYNLIRAVSSPYPGAFTQLEGKDLIIWRARLFESGYCGRPGQVVKISDEGVYVVAGDNRALIIEEAQGVHRDYFLALKNGKHGAKTVVRGIARQFFVSTSQQLSSNGFESMWHGPVA